MSYISLLQELEQKRKKIMKRILYALPLSIVVIVLSLLITQFFQEHSEQIFMYGVMISIIISVGMIFDAYNTYRRQFKEKMMPLLIQKVGTHIDYNYKSGIPENDLMRSKLVRRPDRYNCEDLMQGEFEGVKFSTSDVKLYERHVRRDSKGRRRVSYECYFYGRWFIYDFNKEFNGIIQVREDRLFQGPKLLDIEKISLEDVEFNKKFKTYATHQHDAFYVLTPSLMENIKRLEKRYPGRIYFSFIGTELHIGIYNSGNTFEPPVFKQINDEFIEEQVRDIKIIQQIVNELRLNRKIFK